MNQWLDDLEPFEAEQSRRQIEFLLGALPKAARVLDVGCGGGRVLIPLAAAGHRVTGVERCSDYAADCRRAVGDRAVIIEEQFPGPQSNTPESFDAVLLLGNLLMTYADVDDAVSLLTAARSALASAGAVYIDDIPGDFWPEVAEGYWAGGCNDDNSLQLIWAPDDAVFTIRCGPAVDDGVPELKRDDVRYRLWTAGERPYRHNHRRQRQNLNPHDPSRPCLRPSCEIERSGSRCKR